MFLGRDLDGQAMTFHNPCQMIENDSKIRESGSVSQSYLALDFIGIGDLFYG